MKCKITAACAAILLTASTIAMPASAKNVIRWASQGDALTSDPMAANEAPTNSASRKVYDALIYPDKDLKFKPWLATSWKLLDPVTWEFNLRKNVRFHDGTPFTAADVKFSFERALSKTSDFKRNISSVEAVKIIDDHKVHIITRGPNPILPNQLTSVFIMSKKWSEKHGVTTPQDRAGKEETYAVRHAMGTGPFKLTLREPDVRTVMVKNTDWWGLKEFPHEVDEIVYTPIANQATRVAALLSGEIDFLLDPPLQDLNRIKNTPGMKIKQVAQVRTIFLGMNQGKDELISVKGKNPLKDKRVRQAFYQAINIEAIKKKVMRGYAVPAGLITPPAVHGYTEELNKRRPYDPALSKKLLAEAGYPNGFSIQLDCPNNRYINDEAICQAVVGMLGKIGVKVALSAIPKTIHFPKIKNRETDFYMLGWGVSTLDSHFVFGFLTKSADKGWNGTGFKNQKIDDIINKIEVETDFKKRDAMIQQVWQHMRDNVNYLPLHHQVIVWAMRDKIDLPIVADDGVRFIYTKFKK
ncbi:MAG: ABC transporter substrate-binding protein [Alphaproteobacteria bacterium]|nr:ABC transporter substrate-binding protein [Alphaproteobacteria bacterium]